VVTGSRRAPKVAEVEKWGGKFWVSIEARDRNDVSVFTRNVRQLANTIVRKINMRAVEVLEAAVQAAPTRQVTGNSWGAVVTAGSTASNSTLWPGYDIARAQMLAEQAELGQPGQMRIEQPLATEQWYEEKTQRFWTQSSVRPLMFVDNRFAVLKFVGLT
jgi:hypothetical protein